MDLSRLQEIINYQFVTPRYGEEALQAAGLNVDRLEGNKRLALLGNTILKAVLLDDWYGQPTDCGAGNEIIARVGSSNNIETAARNSGLDGCIRPNPSQRSEQIAPKVVVNTALAVLAAVWRDSSKDWDATRRVMARLNLIG